MFRQMLADPSKMSVSNLSISISTIVLGALTTTYQRILRRIVAMVQAFRDCRGSLFTGEGLLGQMLDFLVCVCAPPNIYCKFKQESVIYRILLDHFLFLTGPPTIQFWPPNQNLGTPSVGSQNGALTPPPTYLGLDVPNLQILSIGDIPGMSTSSKIPFHNVDPTLVHRLSRAQQNLPGGLIFVDQATPLQSSTIRFLKEYHPRVVSYAKAEAPFLLTSDPLKKSRKLCS